MGFSPDALYSNLTIDFCSLSLSDPSVGPFRYLLDNILKKCVTSKAANADDVALSKFLAANQRCSDLDLTPVDFFTEQLISEIRHDLDFLGDFDDEFLVDFGPGSCHGSDNSSLVGKLSGPYTTTSRYVYGLYVQSLRGSSHLSLLNSRDKRYTLVNGSKLAFVPKKDSESRVIACEPLLNMCLQKSVERMLTYKLLRFGICLSTGQRRNRDLAKLGSIDGSFCTIDLSSASDTISLKLCELILPPSLFALLTAIRSPSIKLPCGAEQELFMISSMGNATTFPLETLIFSAAVRAVYRMTATAYNFAVFGDDIIVKNSLFRLVTKALSFLGFSINPSKSFHEGSFRESCGGDYDNGRNVRPVFITSHKSDQDTALAINKLVLWSARHTVDLSVTISYLKSCIRTIPLVPMYESLDAGILSYRNRGSGPYKRFIVKNRFKEAPDSVSSFLAFLRGNVRDGRESLRTFGAPSYRVSLLNSPNWNYYRHGDPLFEDVMNWKYEFFLIHYGLTQD